MLKLLIVSLLFPVLLFSQTTNPKFLARQYNLIPGKKAKIQWERIFQSPHKLKRHGLDKLSTDERNRLKDYLLKHAADSPKPIVPGL